ncbi:Innexin inx2 [Cichlidogyrus casuarinus]|uniref:Innexin inx2 n=1 Tax=Cichlidogyrus casuarinus TaxID=1844966 RepID=A0ABD2PJ70_9PLAT
MLNEKLYIFLWFWTCMVVVCTALSIPTWILRMTMQKNRTNFIKKFIKLRRQVEHSDKDDIHHFINEFLRHDGVFLLRMISLNAGDVITADIVHVSPLHISLFCNPIFCHVPKNE